MTLLCKARLTHLVWLAAVAGSAAVSWGQPRSPQPPEAMLADAMLADAQLADVVFVDRAKGWAVGDRGVIWHTDDGGRNWKLQASGVDCRLSSVCFLTDKIGWAAGGYTQPYSHNSVGVVLHTRNGGLTWTNLKSRVLPAVRAIGFLDDQQGWALGQTSALFPTGVFTTSDGGKSWSAVPGSSTNAWLAGDFLDANSGALAGSSGAVAVVQRRGVEPQPADFGLRALRRMKLGVRNDGWLVGDGGLILTTADAGKSWQTAAGALPPGTANHFDYRALATFEQHCWVAGTPGTRVLHTADGGRSWQVGNTGQSLPIHAMAFIDQHHGWAVGDLGLVLATSDGGRTWKKQRAGAGRAALAGFFSRPAELPLELVALLSADEGYIGTCEILTCDAAELRATSEPEALVHEASVRAGASAASAAWRFPLRGAELKLSAERLVADWNQANDGQALDKLAAHVVGRIRMWRPSIVVTTAAEARDPLTLAVNQVVLSAVEQAADPTRYPEQIAEAGLQPWQVLKVYAALADGPGTTNLNAAQVATRLGRSLGELAAPARGLVHQQYTAPAERGFRLLVDHIPQQAGQRDFFSGIALPPGGEARRAYEGTTSNHLDAARREAQRYRNLQAILARADSQQHAGHFLANVADQTRDMDPDRAVEAVFQLAERYWTRGRWELAAECCETIVERHAHHPLAGAALVWLVQYYASGEAACRAAADGQFSAAQTTVQATARVGADQPAPNGVEQAGGLAAGSVVPAGVRVLNRQQQVERLAKAAGYAERLEQVEPSLAHEPRVRFALAAAQRRQGLSGSADRFMQHLARNRPPDAWWAAARTELWLAERKDRPPKPLWNVRRAATRPRLDGQLEDPAWKAAEVMELRSSQRDDRQWGAVAMLSYDDEFLYLAASCTRAAAFRYRSSAEPRPRDPDLADQDRVELRLDVDRDFTTCYKLTIDHRGWVAESCWRDPTWNPGWFVAAGGDDEIWTAEAAIPLAELCMETPAGGETWAVGLQRVVPGVGLQAWSQPASVEGVGEGLGYLMLHPPAVQ